MEKIITILTLILATSGAVLLVVFDKKRVLNTRIKAWFQKLGMKDRGALERAIQMSKGYLLIILLSFVLGAAILLSGPVPANQNDVVLEEYTYQGQVFRISERESVASFGSPHKVLSLYGIEGDFLDEAVFGDHSIRIESVQDDTLTLLIPVTFYDKGGEDYIQSWLDKNTHIGEFKIEYQVFKDPATSTADFQYPQTAR